MIAARTSDGIRASGRRAGSGADNPSDRLARRCLAAGDLEGAVSHWKAALDQNPEAAEIRYNLARGLADLGRTDQAEAVYLDLVRRSPDQVDALYNLGNLKMRGGDAGEAIQWYRRAVAKAPDRKDCLLNLGMAFKADGCLSEAEAVYRALIRRHGHWVMAHWNLAILLLSQGRWAEGFAEYQWRLKRFERPAFSESKPWWDGSPAHGQHLLLWAEQGVGDAIHFLRFAPFAARRVGRVTLCCHPGLTALAKGAAGVDAVCPFERPLPVFDLHAPLMSLPHLLGMDDPALSWTGPYLASSGAGGKEGRRDGRMRIGLVWSGNPAHTDDARRSCPPEALGPLADLSGVDLVALQKGAAAEAAGRAALGGRIFHLGPGLTDFAHTARVISGLDLVITVDTAVAHLAGAMGKPVWVLLPAVPDWRWMLKRSDSPWYPTARLFRQPRPGDWPSVVWSVCQLLSVRDRRRPEVTISNHRPGEITGP